LMGAMRGTTFDPVVLDAFFRIEPTIIRIAQEFRDEHSPDTAGPSPMAEIASEVASV
jgi:hypothetical protein